MKTTRMLFRVHRRLWLTAAFGLWTSARVWADQDLPGLMPNFEVIPAGSYVIPMDSARQAVGVAVFNMKSYGLVNALLHTNVPVKWAIATGKVKDGMDFSAAVRPLSPASLVLPNPVTTNLKFYAGPFIVDKAYTNLARSVISTYGNNVAIYTVMTNVAADIRYTLTHKPMVAVFNDGGNDKIHAANLIEAGFPADHYQVLSAVNLGFIGVTSCFTIATSPHFDPADNDPSTDDKVQSVRDFVESGGNFLAQCAGARTYENNAHGHFHTTADFMDKNDATKFIYPNPDMAFNQFQGALADQGGSLQEWGLAAGSRFTNSAYLCVQNAAKTNSVRAGVAKLEGNAVGGVIFYLGCHEYKGTDLGNINGRRMYMNAVFVPADRPGNCGITYTVDLELRKTAGTLLAQVHSNVTFSVVVTNKGPGIASGVSVRDVLPSGLDFVSASSGAYTPSNGLWSIGKLGVGGSSSLLITAAATRSGVITNSAQVWTSIQGDPDSTPGNSDPSEDDQSQAIITVEEADLSLTKSVDRYFVQQGSNVTFTVAVTNRGFSKAMGVTVRDVLPAGVAYVSSSGGSYNPVSGIWTIGMLNAGSSTNLQITAAAVGRGAITNSAEVWTSNQHDPDSTPGNGVPAEDDYGKAAIMSVAPGYVISKTLVSPASRPAVVGETVVFQIAVTNSGDVTLDTVPLSDTFNTNFVSFLSTTPPTNTTNLQNVAWSNVGPLAAGAGTVVTARFTAAHSGIWTNQGIATPSMTNGVPVSVGTSSVEHQIVKPGVAITKDLVFPTGRPAAVGETNVFTVTVSNTGNVPLDTVPVNDTFNTALLTFVSAQPPQTASIGDTLAWANVGTLGVGASTVITARFAVVKSGTGTNVVVTAPMKNNSVPVPAATNSVPHTAADASLLVTKRVLSPSGRPAAIGETVSFLIAVTNTGAVPVFTVPLTDRFNTNLLAFTGAAPAQTSLSGDTLMWANVGPLGVGAATSVTATFTALASGIGTNVVATVISTNSVPHTNVNPRVSITKTLVKPSGRPATTGEEVNFEIAVQNIGDTALDVVPVTDSYNAAELSFVGAEPVSRDTLNDGVIEWMNIGPLAPGSNVTIKAHFTATGSGSGTNVAVTAPLMTNGVPVAAATSGVPYAVVSPGVLLTKRLISPLSRPATVGEEIIFGLTVSNTGNIRLDTVPLVDTFDTNLLSAVSQAPAANSTNLPPGMLTWTNVGPLAAGESVTVTARFSSVTSGSGVNVGVTSPSTSNNVPVLASTSSVPHEAVSVGIFTAKQLQSPTGRPAVVGEEVVFTLLVANLSGVALNTVPLLDTFNTSLLEIVSQSPPANSINLVTGTLTWTNVGPVGVSSQVVVTTRFRALASGTGTNVATWSPTTTNALPITPSTSSVPHSAVAPGFAAFKMLSSPTARPAAVGEPVSFKITVTNTGDISLGRVTLDDTYDVNILAFDSSAPQVSAALGNRLTWDNVGPLPVGGSTDIVVHFTAIGSTRQGVTTNTVISTITEMSGMPVGSQTNKAMVRVVAPAVTLAKALIYPADRPAAVGETNVFTVTVRNTGDYPLDTVPVTDRFNGNLLEFVSAVPTQNSQSGNVLTWDNLGRLDAGGSTVITARFSVVHSGTGTNTVVTTPATTDNVPVPAQTNSVPHTAADASLRVTKSVLSPPGRPAAIGEAVSFLIAVTNTGAVPVYTVPLADRFNTNLLAFTGAVPAQTSLTGDTLAWANVGPLDVGAAASVTATFTALTNGIGTNYVFTVTSTNAVPHTNVNPRVSIEKDLVYPLGRPAIVGESNVFAITVSNTGDYPLDRVPVTDTFNASLLSFVSAVPAQNSLLGNVLAWDNMGPLGVGESTVITARFSAVSAGTGVNRVVTAPITVNAVPVPPMTNSAVHIAFDAPLFMSKRIVIPAGRPAGVGEQVEFAITVSNKWAVPLYEVPLADTFDTNLLGFVSAVPPPSGQNGATLSWANVGPLAAGGSTNVSAWFNVLASGVGTNRVDSLFCASEVAYTNVNPCVSIDKKWVFPQDRSAAYEETNVFTITVSNTGDYPLDPVPVEDTYWWDMLTFISSEPPADSEWGVEWGIDGMAGVNWDNVGPLLPGESVTITARFSAVYSGTGVNMVVTSPSTINDVPVQPATNDVKHTTVDPNVSIVKVLVSPSYGNAAQIGEAVVFWIEVENTGDATLDIVPVTDTYDAASLSYMNASPPAEVRSEEGVVSWANVGPLEPGASKSLFLTFKARAGTAPPVPQAFRGLRAGQVILNAINTVTTVPATADGVPVPSQTGMARYGVDAAVDVDMVSDYSFTNVLSGTLVHKVSDSGTNQLLVVGISINNTEGAWGMVTNVRYGNLALTLAGAVTKEDKVAAIWYLANPPAGTTEVAANFDQAPGEGWVMGAITFRNVDPVSPCGAFLSSVGGSGDPMLEVSPAVGEVIVDTVALQCVSLSAYGYERRQCWSLNSETNVVAPFGFTSGGGSTITRLETTALPITNMAWTAEGNSTNWAMGALVIRPYKADTTGKSAVQSSVVLSSRNPSVLGQSVFFTATFAGAVGTPSGTVQFKIDGINFGSLTNLIDGMAVSDAVSDLAVGNHSVQAVYSGDMKYLSSVSPVFQQTVGDVPPPGTVLILCLLSHLQNPVLKE